MASSATERVKKALRKCECACPNLPMCATHSASTERTVIGTSPATMAPAATSAPLTPMLSPRGREMSKRSSSAIASANQRAALHCSQESCPIRAADQVRSPWSVAPPTAASGAIKWLGASLPTHAGTARALRALERTLPQLRDQTACPIPGATPPQTRRA